MSCTLYYSLYLNGLWGDLVGYYVKETVEDVKKQFTLYYPAAMEWIADNIEHIESYIVEFPHETDDDKGGSYCKFSIDINIFNGDKLVLDCYYTFSTNCEEGIYYAEPTLKHFNSWSNAGRLIDPTVRIGNDNISGYIKRLDEKLAKIME